MQRVYMLHVKKMTVRPKFEGIFFESRKQNVQCNLDLVTLNLVTILQRPFFNLLHKIICFSDSH